MPSTNSEISFYVDTLILETVLRDESIKKQADASSLVSSLLGKIKEYASNNIDENDKVGSALKILAPGALSVGLSAMGLPWLGTLLGLALRVFHIDVSQILKSIYEKVKGAIGDGKQVTSSQIDDAVQSSVQEHTSPATEEEAMQAAQLLGAKSSHQLLRDARIVKLTMIDYKLNKTAGFASAFNSRKTKTASILSRVLSVIFKVVLASAGLMVAGDVVNKFLGRPNALDGSVRDGKPVETGPVVQSGPTSTQTKFPVKSSYIPEKFNINSNWSEKINNDENSIGNMLIQFAKSVYDGLDGKESIIKGTPGYQSILDRISFFNRNTPGIQLTFIPPEFNSKKQIVDYFIDDVAEKA